LPRQFALVTLNQLVLDDMMKHLVDDIRKVTAEFESTIERAQTRFGAAIARDLRRCLIELRTEAENSVADSNRTRSDPRVAREGWLWLLFFACGVTIGLLLHMAAT
jgi:hypothetical protein